MKYKNHNRILQLYTNKFDKIEEMGKFLETYSSPKLNQGKKDNLNRLIFASEIESVIKKKIPCKQKSRTGWLH